MNLPQKTNRSISVREDFLPFEGMEIASIEVIVFDEKNQVIEDTAQWNPNVHFVSKPNQYRWNAKLVKRQLMFREGDLVDAQLMVDNEVVLRQRTIYRDAVIQLHIIDDHRVKINVLVQNNRHWQVLFEGGPGSIQLGLESMIFSVYHKRFKSLPKEILISGIHILPFFDMIYGMSLNRDWTSTQSCFMRIQAKNLRRKCNESF